MSKEDDSSINMNSDRLNSVITEDFKASKLQPFRLITSSSGFPFVGIAPTSKPSTSDPKDSIISTDLFFNHQARLRGDPITFAAQLGAWVSNTGWRAYADILGGKIMYDGYSAMCIR
jgi:hypothetical protein